MKRQCCSLQNNEQRNLLSSFTGPYCRACPHICHTGDLTEEGRAAERGRKLECLIALSHGQVHCQKKEKGKQTIWVSTEDEA